MEAEKSHDLHLQVGDLNESQWCSLKARQPKSSSVDSSQSLMPKNQEHWGQEKIHVPGE